MAGAREIPRPDWAAFTAEFTRLHHGWLATLERRRAGAVEVLAAQEALHAVRFDPDAGSLAVQTHGAGGLHEAELRMPVLLRTLETAAGAQRELQARNGEGEELRLRFRSTVLPEALDGLAASEAPD